MSPTTYLGLLLFFLLIGISCINIEKFKDYSMAKRLSAKSLIIFGIFVLLGVGPILIDYGTEKVSTLKSFIDYYGLQYGDTLDFTYHIKTNIKETNKRKKCKINGSINNGNLTIKTEDNCDQDEDIKEKYLHLLSTRRGFDDEGDISKNSKIKNII